MSARRSGACIVCAALLALPAGCLKTTFSTQRVTEPVYEYHRVRIQPPPIPGQQAATPPAPDRAPPVVCHDVYKLTCSLAVVDEKTGVRWETALPESVIQRQTGPLLAVSEDRVVLVAGFDSKRMLAWDVQTGKEISL